MRNDLRFCERAQNGGPCFSSKFKGGPLLDVRVKRFSPFRLAVRYVECAQVKRRRQSPGKLRNVTEFGPEDTRTQAGQWVKTVFAKPGSPAYLWEVVQCRSRGLYQRRVCGNFVIGRLDYRDRVTWQWEIAAEATYARPRCHLLGFGLWASSWTSLTPGLISAALLLASQNVNRKGSRSSAF